MINNYDDIKESIIELIYNTPSLLRNKQLFYAATENAFFDIDHKNSVDMRKRIDERVTAGMQLLNSMV